MGRNCCNSRMDIRIISGALGSVIFVGGFFWEGCSSRIYHFSYALGVCKLG